MSNVNRVGGGNLLDVDRLIKNSHLVHCPQVHGNLANHVNFNINGSSKLDSSRCVPSSSSDDDSTAFTTSDIGCPQVTGAMIFSSFILTPAIFTGGSVSDSGDNSAFGAKAKSESIAENEDLIPHASLYENKKIKFNASGIGGRINYSRTRGFYCW